MSAPDQRPFQDPGTVGPGNDDSAERSGTPINPATNRVTDPVWGTNGAAGGPNQPEQPAVTTDPC